MATGGYFGYDDPDLDDKIDHDDDKDDTGDEQEVNRARPFQPGEASTPYHVGEQHEMQTMMHEHSGLPDTSYIETPLLFDLLQPEEKQRNLDKALDFIKKKFPKVDLKKTRPNWFQQKRPKS